MGNTELLKVNNSAHFTAAQSVLFPVYILTFFEIIQ